MIWLIPIISAIAYRTDGWGRRDTFLPIYPFNLLPRVGGINYTRCCVGILPAILFHNLWFIPAYIIAGLIPYGENSPLQKYPFNKDFNWFFYGYIWGLASLSFGNALFCSLLFWFLMQWSNYGIGKKYKLDHAYLEFMFGGLSTLIFSLRG